MYCAQVVQGEGFTIFLRKPVDDQIYLTVQTGGIPQRLDHLVTSIYQSIDDILQDAKACVVHERIFGSNTCQHSILESRNRSLSKCCGDTGSGLFTFIEGKPVWGEGLAGIQVLAVSPRTSTEKVQVIYEKGAAVGRIWRRHGNTFVMLQNLHGQLSNSPAEDSRTAEVGRMFERTERLLKQVHGDYRDVVRTWLYLSEILKWYPQFNEVRNSAYARFGIMPSTTDHEPVHRLTLPASTGIQAENPLGAACLMDVLAIVGQSRPPVVQMSNSRQKDAFRYRS
ncbi:MAG TPA: hypothetical protein PKH07_13755, partial [bacterium]|nr:hypothetical protein [bacterium]